MSDKVREGGRGREGVRESERERGREREEERERKRERGREKGGDIRKKSTVCVLD